MKKLALFLALALVFAAVATAETVEQPEYPLLYVSDIYLTEDEDLPEEMVVQACFGAIDTTVEAEPVFIGFDSNEIHSFGVAENCVFLVPEDPTNEASDLVPTDDVLSWFEDTMMHAEFYATYKLNEAGDLTELSYCYFPFG